ncbi:unnamed protein product [Lymnaea stagnalis]|uniref:CUB domain-containing protein n=1 Tax=Lymnaea stagnalis TaxID=6523 RepID=A0AAV2HVH2_LYMST
MKGLTRNGGPWLYRSIVWLAIVAVSNYVEGGCQTSVTELWAYSNPTTFHVTDNYIDLLTSDKGGKCNWVITASATNDVVELSFPEFQLKNSDDKDSGDCIRIYDGKTKDDPLLDKLCDKQPAGTYSSSERTLLVVYKRGEVAGERRFTMKFSSKEVISKEKIIKIAGIVGAVLAGIGLTFIILRATRCCSCLRNKQGSNSNVEQSSSIRETTRLTQLPGEDDVEVVAHINGNNQPHAAAATTSVPMVPTIAQLGDGAEAADGSDTDSLPDVDEPPPSYESLYLNELGESITPPNYSPPKHRSTHPPRRVHTIN